MAGTVVSGPQLPRLLKASWLEKKSYKGQIGRCMDSVVMAAAMADRVVKAAEERVAALAAGKAVEMVAGKVAVAKVAMAVVTAVAGRAVVGKEVVLGAAREEVQEAAVKVAPRVAAMAVEERAADTAETEAVERTEQRRPQTEDCGRRHRRTTIRHREGCIDVPSGRSEEELNATACLLIGQTERITRVLGNACGRPEGARIPID